MSVLPTVLQGINLISAGIAATLWFRSATIKTPAKITVGYGGEGGSVQELGDRLRWQSRLSAWAAVAAGVSVLAQAVASALPSE